MTNTADITAISADKLQAMVITIMFVTTHICKVEYHCQSDFQKPFDYAAVASCILLVLISSTQALLPSLQVPTKQTRAGIGNLIPNLQHVFAISLS